MDEQIKDRLIIYLLIMFGMWAVAVEGLLNPIFVDGTFLSIGLRISTFAFMGSLMGIVSIGLFIGFFPDIAIDIYDRIKLNVYDLIYSEDDMLKDAINGS